MNVSLDSGIRHNVEMINTIREIYNNKTFTVQELVLKLKEAKVKYYSILPKILIKHKYLLQVSTIKKTRKPIPLYKFDKRPVHFEVYFEVEKCWKGWQSKKQKVNITDISVCPDCPDRQESDFKLNISDKINLVKILAESNNIDLIIKLKLITE